MESCKAWFPSRSVAILWVLMASVCSLYNPQEQTSSNKTYKMAINRLGDHTGKKKHTAEETLQKHIFFPIQILIL